MYTSQNIRGVEARSCKGEWIILCGLDCSGVFFLKKEIYCTESVRGVYKDELQNCSCNVTNLNKYLHYGTSRIE